jgi:glutamine amidotransferase-like uncharacterized protein
MKSQKIELILFLILLMSAVPSVLADGASEWPMFHHDPNHTGHTTSTGPVTNNVLWSYTTGYYVESSPAVSNGYVYIGSMDYKVYAFGDLKPPEVISVALYNGSGDSGYGACKACVASMKLMFEWMGCNVTRVYPEDIINGRLEGYDVLAWPGGLARASREVMGQQGIENIQRFISNGGGYFGICAGAIWASDYQIFKGDPDSPPPDYWVLGKDLNLDLFPGVAVNPIEENGPFVTPLTPRINIVNHNHPITNFLPDQMTIYYVGGPELLPYEGANVTILGTYDATGTPAIVAFEYGNGRVFLIGPHPEFEEESDRDGWPPDPTIHDPESEWPFMLNAVEWLAHKPIPVTTISCNSSSSAITAGDTINITGSISPALPGETVTLLYTRPSVSTLTSPIKTNVTYLELCTPIDYDDYIAAPYFFIPNPDGTTWSVYASPNISTVTRNVTTDSSGAYSDLYAPDTNGTWTVYASWSFDDHHIAASQNVEFEVKQNATLTIQSSASNVAPGSTVILSGSLSPAQAGDVTIFRSINNSAFVSIGTAARSNGAYSYQTSLNDTGTYWFKASWPGNENYNASTSGAITVTATAAGIDPLLYVVIAGVVIVAIAAAVYFMRRK